MDTLGRFVSDAVLGIDTLWGGDVMCPSGTGRFIADSWFSDEPLPPAYTAPAAARVRETGGVSGKNVDRQAVEQYLHQVDVPQAVAGIRDEAHKVPGMRGQYLHGLSLSLETMWDLAMEVFGKGKPVPYTRCVEASTGRPPEPSDPKAKRERVAELLGRAGYSTSGSTGLLGAVDAWRRDRVVPMASVRALGAAVTAHFDRLSAANLLPYLPQHLLSVPRANIEFLPIKDAWFSGSMNYIGRARKPDGSPHYEATYEINASLQISVPEFEQLVSHEVVPGHVTTFAYLQDLYVRGKAGFEATVLTMNTLSATLFEGIANNAILIAQASPKSSNSRTKTCRSGCCWHYCRMMPRISRRTYSGEKGCSATKWLPFFGRISWSRKSAPTSFPAPGVNIRYWVECIFPLIARERSEWHNCAAFTRRIAFCRPFTAAMG